MQRWPPPDIKGRSGAIDWAMATGVLSVLMVYVAMVYGPIAAAGQMFPALSATPR